MKRNYSFEPFNLLAPLAGLFIKLGGEFPKFLDRRSVWFCAEVNGGSAGVAFPASDVLKPTKNYFLDMAALAAEVEKLLLKHAEGHEYIPPKGASSIASSVHASASGGSSDAIPESP